MSFFATCPVCQAVHLSLSGCPRCANRAQPVEVPSELTRLRAQNAKYRRWLRYAIARCGIREELDSGAYDDTGDLLVWAALHAESQELSLRVAGKRLLRWLGMVRT